MLLNFLNQIGLNVVIYFYNSIESYLKIMAGWETKSMLYVHAVESVEARRLR